MRTNKTKGLAALGVGWLGGLAAVFLCGLAPCVLLLSGCAHAGPRSGVAASALVELGDDWLGGVSWPRPASSVPSLRVDFARGTVHCSARATDAVAPIVHASARGHDVHFEAVLDGALVAFDGSLSGASLDGQVRSLGTPISGRFHLEQLVPLGDRVSALSGTFRRGPHVLWVGADEGILRVLDVQSGEVRAIFARRDGSFWIGSGTDDAFPISGSAQFSLDADGRASELSWERTGAERVTVARSDPATREVRFGSHGVELAGSLYLPAGPGPHPVVVGVHGSGRLTRHDWWTQAMVAVFLREGFAVYAYDKRGTGASGGQYVGRGAADTNNVSPENLALLADDAAAAADAVAVEAGVDPARVGLYGISQAGWIIPGAVRRTSHAAFAIILSGPTVATSLEGVYSHLIGDGSVLSSVSHDDAEAVVSLVAPSGFDPAPDIAELRVPVLWIYGQLDSSIPVVASRRVLDRLVSARRTAAPFEIVTLPDAGHMLFQVARDDEAGFAASPGFEHELLPTIRSWLAPLVSHPG